MLNSVCLCSLAISLMAGNVLGQAGFDISRKIDSALFANPPKECRQHAWLTLDLSKATEQNLAEEIKRWAQDDKTGGFYLGIGGGKTTGLSEEYLKGSGRKPSDTGVAFLSDEYFDLYAKAIEAGLKNGNPPMVFYDEWGYPSGMAGGLLYSRYPQFGAKSLEKVEQDLIGPGRVTLPIPDGILVGAVIMSLDTRDAGQELTTVPLKLDAVSAVFLVTAR